MLISLFLSCNIDKNTVYHFITRYVFIWCNNSIVWYSPIDTYMLAEIPWMYVDCGYSLIDTYILGYIPWMYVDCFPYIILTNTYHSLFCRCFRENITIAVLIIGYENVRIIQKLPNILIIILSKCHFLCCALGSI